MASFWSKYRKRLAFLVLVVAAVVIGRELSGAALRDVELVYDLGPDHAEFVELRIAYVSAEDEVAGVRFQEAAGLPSRLDHAVELSPGRYTVEAVLTGPELDRRVSRALRVPADGRVHMDLFDTAYARRSAP